MATAVCFAQPERICDTVMSAALLRFGGWVGLGVSGFCIFLQRMKAERAADLLGAEDRVHNLERPRVCVCAGRESRVEIVCVRGGALERKT